MISTRDYSIGEAIEVYIQDAKSYYQGSRESGNLDSGLRRFFEGHVDANVVDIRTPLLASIRDRHARAGRLSRSYINKLLGFVGRFLKFCAERGLVSASQVHEVESVRKIKRGRHGVAETAAVEPANPEHVQLVRDASKPTIASYIDMMLLTGMRPGEARIMRAKDLELATTNSYIYSPAKHKTEHRGKTRFIAIIGPAFDLTNTLIHDLRVSTMFRDDEYLFAPQGDGRRAYAECSIGQAIRRICDDLQIPRWSPNQIRHRVATTFDEQGHETKTISTVMGHSSTKTTQIYIHEQKSKVLEAALKLAS